MAKMLTFRLVSVFHLTKKKMELSSSLIKTIYSRCSNSTERSIPKRVSLVFTLVETKLTVPQ